MSSATSSRIAMFGLFWTSESAPKVQKIPDRVDKPGVHLQRLFIRISSWITTLRSASTLVLTQEMKEYRNCTVPALYDGHMTTSWDDMQGGIVYLSMHLISSGKRC